MKRPGLLFAAVVVASATMAVPTGDARAEGVKLQVIAQRASVHTGPTTAYREVYVATRGQEFEVLERARTGYWFRVMLDDGTTGWIQGELVFAIDQPASSGGLFARMGRALQRTFMAPPRIGDASAALAFSAGILDGDGLFVLRPAYVIEPHVAIEATLGLSPRGQTDVFVGGLGLALRLIPDAIIDPFITLGVGAAHLRPKADNFVDEQQTLMTVAAGGGFELTFKKQITVRLDARRWLLFDPDQSAGGTEFSAGLVVFF